MTEVNDALIALRVNATSSAGEKEYEAAERNLRDGVPLDVLMVADLKALAQELDLEHPRIQQ